MKNLSLLEKIISLILLITVIYAIYVYFTDSAYFEYLVQEDGFYENLTSAFLFFTSFALLIKFFKYQKYYGALWKVGVLLMALGLFFGGGEEISWGQRIFHIQSSEFFKENNAQEETNLHNMVVGDVKLNKLIFSNLMSICFGIYFLVLPILWNRSPKIKILLDKFGISVARPVHIVIFIIATALILLPINHSRKWEIWEYAFALIMFLIVYNPLNVKEIFSKETNR
ncbi:MAG: hypothetical protein DI622_04510 [Chryseobacterium sp.]|uniref:hypothetical protein n=1 Tax=unclassified Chryseobacterium TaxID=2593645 RepID=UPI000DB25512|nr:MULTISPECIES: hypothetical protein [unclassified Chryseobacterium]MPS65296.1 hypothetical protein [Chryseobacterium sp.]PZU23725.1 MAG: hypothetical protein DI622_04510 [Chryseobacterium sp.]UMQ43886.1 hypothetical protein MKS83_09300 [Chryseobacterium sp. Y16C]